MTKTIEKLERNVRKKMREIEGLRWLVIHHGAASDIDAAANLARSSFSTQEGDAFDAARGTSPLPPTPVVPAPHDNGPLYHSGQAGDTTVMTATTSTPEYRSNLSSSALPSLAPSVSESQSSATSLSVIPEWVDIPRTDRQKLKGERRASKALRRLSASLAMGNDPCTQTSSGDSSIDPNFDPKQSIDEVLEKLEPFRLA
ncbi:hypothetical protein JVU11DRAFT_9862 [Chiua virens]|nr:hypothetical protein JVU11DRAFT_9862 [Chiua virens]